MDIDRDAQKALAEVLPDLRKKLTKQQEAEQKLQREYGVFVNHVAPIMFQGGKVWAIGSRVYPNRPPNETFHEFLIYVLRETLGEPWRAEQAARPEAERHFIVRCSDAYGRWKAENADLEALEREGRFGALPNGWVQSFASLAWDVATLIHASNLPDSLVNRLRDDRAYQGARYEIAVAAIFARLNFGIEFLDEQEELRREKHVEFIATYRPTGVRVAVEAKSRHRTGVLNEEGEQDADDPLKGDMKAVRRLFVKAVEKAPEDFPFMVFIDVNAPLDPAEPFEKEWQQQVKRWLGRFPAPSIEAPDVYNALVITNFSPHYDGDDLARRGEWLAIWPNFARHPLGLDFVELFRVALDAYGRVPDIREGGEVGD